MLTGASTSSSGLTTSAGGLYTAVHVRSIPGRTRTYNLLVRSEVSCPVGRRGHSTPGGSRTRTSTFGEWRAVCYATGAFERSLTLVQPLHSPAGSLRRSAEPAFALRLLSRLAARQGLFQSSEAFRLPGTAMIIPRGHEVESRTLLKGPASPPLPDAGREPGTYGGRFAPYSRRLSPTDRTLESLGLAIRSSPTPSFAHPWGWSYGGPSFAALRRAKDGRATRTRTGMFLVPNQAGCRLPHGP